MCHFFLPGVLIWNPTVFFFFFLNKTSLFFCLYAKTRVQNPRIYRVNVKSCSN